MDEEIQFLKDKILALESRVAFLETKLGISNASLSQSAQQSEGGLQAYGRDKTKYVFKNKILPKNRLVLSIVSDYVKNNPNITLCDLQNIFDKSLQGSLQVVEDYNNALQIKDCSKRYFCDDSELLTLADGQRVAVCTQWGIFNIKKFIVVASQLGYEIKEI